MMSETGRTTDHRITPKSVHNTNFNTKGIELKIFVELT